jgi:hypothetical protein
MRLKGGGFNHAAAVGGHASREAKALSWKMNVEASLDFAKIPDMSGKCRVSVKLCQNSRHRRKNTPYRRT